MKPFREPFREPLREGMSNYLSPFTFHLQELVKVLKQTYVQ